MTSHSSKDKRKRNHGVSQTNRCRFATSKGGDYPNINPEARQLLEYGADAEGYSNHYDL